MRQSEHSVQDHQSETAESQQGDGQEQQRNNGLAVHGPSAGGIGRVHCPTPNFTASHHPELSRRPLIMVCRVSHPAVSMA